MNGPSRLATQFLILCVSWSLASAKEQKAQTGSVVKVVARVSFGNNTPVDMLVRQVNGKSYLYVQLAGGIQVVDITKPKNSKVVTKMSSFEGTSQFAIKGNAAMASSDGAAAQAGSGELVLWDVSNAKSPQVVQHFTQVLRVLQDDRGYTYVLNRDGLWVVRDRREAGNVAEVTDDPSLYGGGG